MIGSYCTSGQKHVSHFFQLNILICYWLLYYRHHCLFYLFYIFIAFFMLMREGSIRGGGKASLLLLDLSSWSSSNYLRLSLLFKNYLFSRSDKSLFRCSPHLCLTIMVLRISLQNTQSMLIESSSHSGSIPYYALDQLHKAGGPGRSMYLTQLDVDSWDTEIDGVAATQILRSSPLCCAVSL